jgi:hypothetical protein
MPFTCDVCNKETNTGHGIPGTGMACSPKCAKVLQKKRLAFHEKLLSEELGECPDKLDVPAFERFALKFALQFLRGISDKDRKRLMKNCPLVLMPEEMALEVKEKVLRHIPLYYVSSMEARGHERLFHSGTYGFKCKVPQKVVMDAFFKAELLKKSE